LEAEGEMRNEKGERLRLRLRLRQEEISAKVLQCCSQKGERGWRLEAGGKNIRYQSPKIRTRNARVNVKDQRSK
jgi:hypothetical protein